jgi:1-acyl-sn-glycerol-3-phosphate acyltransferase
VRFAAKDRLLDYPLLGWLLRTQPLVRVTRGRESAADDLADAVRGGGAIAIFPEGTFVRAPGLLPFRLGAFRAAVVAGCPVVPVALKGTRDAWPDETRLIRRRRLEVQIGEPIWPGGTGWAEVVRLRDLARDALASEIGEPAFQPHSPDSHARAIGRA